MLRDLLYSASPKLTLYYMKLLKPKKLAKGDLIGLISPASSPDDLEKIGKAVKYFESIGYRVIVGKNVGKYRGYLAGTDDERLTDLHEMFKNKDVKAIICLRGGYGTGRILDKINYNLIKKNPKIFVGYSDITALHAAIYTKTGLVTFAGPMAAVDFYENPSSFTEKHFWDLLTNNKKIGKIENPNSENFYTLNKGRGEGRLFPANLTVLVSIIGSDYFPNIKDTVWVFEDIDEPPYRIDRMFNQLRLNKVFKQSKGIILGRFVNCYESDKTKKTLTLNEVITDYFSELKIPILYNIKHGHISDNITFPVGVKTKVNASRGFIEITENAVS